MANKFKSKFKKTRLLALIMLIISGINMGFAASGPGNITYITAQSANASAILTWNEPENNGSPIIGYTVEYKLIITEDWTECTDASCTDSTTGAIVPGLSNWTTYIFRVKAHNLIGDSDWSDIVSANPTPCGTLVENDDSGGTTTVTETCVGLNIVEGSLFIENIPDSFIFPLKFSSPTSDQASFNNDNPTTPDLDVTTNENDILTVRDLRNDPEGFYITVTSTQLTNGQSFIPLENLYITTTCPDEDDLAPDLYGSPPNCTSSTGVEFAQGASNTGEMKMDESVHSDNATGTLLNTLINAFTTDGKPLDSADPGLEADTIVIMDSLGDRIARMSQAVGFYLNIPADTDAGVYSVLFTIDLVSSHSVN